MESLFSLEVIVNFVKLNNNNNQKIQNSNSSRTTSCLFPTVAFRLLDYPTIAINLLDDYDAKDLKKKFHLTQPFKDIEKLPCLTDLLDIHGRYIFSKGKSCLFKSDLEVLRGHLRNTPMYLMILDTFFEPYKLVGTVAVPLNNLINEIYNETNNESDEPSSVKNHDIPCVKMSHGVFDIKNLIGECVGHISFAVRLTSFGTSLLPHIDNATTEAVQRRLKENKIQKKLSIESIKEEKTELEQSKIDKTEPELYIYELHKNTSQKSTNTLKQNQNALVQTLEIDYKDAQVQISNYPAGNKKNKSTQSPDSRRKFSDVSSDRNELYQVKHVEDEFAFKHYCPPALHYNSDSKKENKIFLNNNKNIEMISNEQNSRKSSIEVNSQQLVNQIINQNVFINQRIEYLKHATETEEIFENDQDDEDRNNQEENNSETDEQDNYIIKQFPVKNIQTSNQFNFDQMPLLKCLFDEMTKLKNLIENSAQPQKQQLKKMNQQINTNMIKSQTDSKLINQSRSKSPKSPKSQINSSRKKNLVGILKNKHANTMNKEKLLESVDRLSQPKTNQKKLESQQKYPASEYDEIPVRGPKEEVIIKPKKILKYGLTNTHRMRVLASRPNQVKQVEQKHESLIKEVKKNLDELNLSSATSIEQTSDVLKLHNNLEKVLFFESTGSMTSGTMNQQRTMNSLKNTNGSTKSPMNFSLLNRVDMESTFDTMNYQNTNMIKFENDNNIKNQHQEQQIQPTNTTKVVQFGNTYVYMPSSGQQSEESVALTSPSSNSVQQVKKEESQFQNENRSSIDESSYSKNMKNKNIFLNGKQNYEYDFNSSLDSTLRSSKQSSSTTSNFITANLNRNSIKQNAIINSNDDLDEESYSDLLGKINQSDLKTSSKYSNSIDNRSYNSRSFLDESFSSTNKD